MKYEIDKIGKIILLILVELMKVNLMRIQVDLLGKIKDVGSGAKGLIAPSSLVYY